MVIPGVVIVLVVLALIAYGEWKEWRGHQQGKLVGETAERQKLLPLIQQEVRERDKYWLNVLKVHNLPTPPAPVVLQLPDGMELRQKARPRLPREVK